jgi:regulator of sigma E protease
MSILVAIIAVGVLIALHEVGHFAAARRVGMKVLRYSIGFFKPLFSWQSKKSGVVYQVGAVPLGGFVQIAGMNPFEQGAEEDPDAYINKPVWKRAIVLVAGPGANLLIAWLLLFGLYATSGIPQYVDKSGVGTVFPDTPAEKAGLKTGDIIEKLNGEALTTWDDLVSRLRDHPNKQVTLQIRRAGVEERLFIRVIPTDVDGVGKIGIGQPQIEVSLPVHVAALGALKKCFIVVGGSLSSLAGLVTGGGEDVEAIGPVGIVKMAANTFETGIREFLALVAYLSLMLFMFNLLPLPALDGGRGVFLLYEAVARRRVNPRVDVLVNSAGFILLVGLLIFITIKEVLGI